jgi:hypothetical protein
MALPASSSSRPFGGARACSNDPSFARVREATLEGSGAPGVLSILRHAVDELADAGNVRVVELLVQHRTAVAGEAAGTTVLRAREEELGAAFLARAERVFPGKEVIERRVARDGSDDPDQRREDARGAQWLSRHEFTPSLEAELAAFLKSAEPLARAESFTPLWLAFRAQTNVFYIVDAFATEADRGKHLSGEIAKALLANADALLAEAPKIEQVDVLADKV